MSTQSTEHKHGQTPGEKTTDEKSAEIDEMSKAWKGCDQGCGKKRLSFGPEMFAIKV